VLGVGRLAPQKNFARFIDVIAQVSRQLPVEAVIAGADQGCLSNLESQTARLGLQRIVRLIGTVPDAHELICAADIFLLSSDYEGMPNVVLESMAAGVPCVATRVNGIPDLIQQGATGFVCALNTDDLAQHVTWLAADADRRRAMGSQALAAIEKGFQAEEVVRQLWKVCE
jgi:glycosyltransferase involved in cell wall biosynthesis